MIRETGDIAVSPDTVEQPMEQPMLRDAENSSSLDGNAARLPDDSGEKQFRLKLPNDSGEAMPQKNIEAMQPAEIDKQKAFYVGQVDKGYITLETTAEKGIYGEMKMDLVMAALGYQRISLVSLVNMRGDVAVNSDLADAESVRGMDTKHGIDGVFHNKDGHPPYIIMDAKYNTAQLEEKTTHGKQMSEAWIDANLDKAVGQEKADEIRMAILDGNVECYVCRVAKENNLDAPACFEKLDSNGNVTEKDVRINAA